jgi:hypothetical protein
MYPSHRMAVWQVGGDKLAMLHVSLHPDPSLPRFDRHPICQRQDVLHFYGMRTGGTERVAITCAYAYASVQPLGLARSDMSATPCYLIFRDMSSNAVQSRAVANQQPPAYRHRNFVWNALRTRVPRDLTRLCLPMV